MPVDEQRFRQALGHFATGVTIVTMRDRGGQPQGLTANSLTSVSLDPPLVLVCIDRRISAYPVMQEVEGWVVNILAADQEELSRRFATPDIDKFDGVAFESGAYGAPLIGGALATLAVRSYARHDGGDHEIFVGEVTDVDFHDGEPLVFYKGMYALPSSIPTVK